MSNLGVVFEDDEDYSPSRMNAKGVLRDTGTNIVALATTKQLGLVCPTNTSSGLIKNVLYYVDYDTDFNRIGFEPVFHKHDHSADTDAKGGKYLDIRIANIRDFAEISILTVSPDPSSVWDIVTGSGGSISFIQASPDVYHQAATGNTTGAHVTGILGGVMFEWSNIIMCQFNSSLNANSNILARTGIGIDSINNSPSTSRKQMALEGCDGHGTNWVLLNANGSSASLEITPTTMPLNPGSVKNYLLEHIPATECNVYYGNVLNATSSTNVADDGTTEPYRLFRWGIKLPTGTVEIKQNLWWLKILGNHRVF